jgi:cell division septation protein DedD
MKLHHDHEETGEQKDLFSELIQDTSSPSYDEGQKPGKLTLTLNVDKVLLFILTCAIIFAVVFSYGIETGKKLQNDNGDDLLMEIEATPQEGDVSDHANVLGFFGTEAVAPSLASEPLPASGIPASGTSTAAGPSTTETLVLPFVAPQAVETSAEVLKPPEVIVPIEEKKEELPLFWTVQIITYINKTYATEELKKLKEKELEGFILPSGKYFQICVGKFATKDEAAKFLEKFKKQKDYADAYIRQVENAKIIN